MIIIITSSYPFSFTAYNVNNQKRARKQYNQRNDETANQDSIY